MFRFRGRRWLVVGLAALALSFILLPRRRPDVILIVIDTLRADRLGAYGNRRGLTPFLDWLAARGAVYTHAYAPASWTTPSVASLFTSRLPSQHAVLRFTDGLRHPTLAEALREAGYHTGAFVANGLLRNDKFGRGFDRYRSWWMSKEERDRHQKRRANEVNEAALRWLDRRGRGKPYFLYLHYIEPHLPYSPPPATLKWVVGDAPVPDPVVATNIMFVGNTAPPDPPALRALEKVYDAEVASVDESIQKLLTALDRRHRLDNAIVVVTSDHGEEFLDHRLMGHGQSLYEELIRVPLIVARPGERHGRIVDEVVSLIDIAPTLTDLAGAATPDTFEGQSRRSDLPGPAWRRTLAGLRGRGSDEAMSELISPGNVGRLTPHERAIVGGRQKLILGFDGERERYDLGADPREQKPLDSLADETRLEAAVARLGPAAAAVRSAGPEEPIPPELAERLRALGYLK